MNAEFSPPGIPKTKDSVDSAQRKELKKPESAVKIDSPVKNQTDTSMKKQQLVTEPTKAQSLNKTGQNKKASAEDEIVIDDTSVDVEEDKKTSQGKPKCKDCNKFRNKKGQVEEFVTCGTCNLPGMY